MPVSQDFLKGRTLNHFCCCRQAAQKESAGRTLPIPVLEHINYKSERYCTSLLAGKSSEVPGRLLHTSFRSCRPSTTTLSQSTSSTVLVEPRKWRGSTKYISALRAGRVPPLLNSCQRHCLIGLLDITMCNAVM